MVEMRVFCDRCHERVVDGRSSYRATFGPAKRSLESLDLCDECFEHLGTWVKTFPKSGTSKPAVGDGNGSTEQRKRTARAAV
jgi:hypothetical protein